MSVKVDDPLDFRPQRNRIDVFPKIDHSTFDPEIARHRIGAWIECVSHHSDAVNVFATYVISLT